MAGFAKPEEVGLSSELLGRIRPWLRGYLETGKLPGATTLVARHGKIVFCESEGFRDLEASKPMTADTILRFYSMTKPITSVALMMLYEEGLFQLDDPVSENCSKKLGRSSMKKNGPRCILKLRKSVETRAAPLFTCLRTG